MLPRRELFCTSQFVQSWKKHLNQMFIKFVHKLPGASQARTQGGTTGAWSPHNYKYSSISRSPSKFKEYFGSCSEEI